MPTRIAFDLMSHIVKDAFLPVSRARLTLYDEP